MVQKKLDWFTIVNTVIMLLLIVTMLFPFIYMASISLSGHEFVNRGEVFLWPKGFTLHWYDMVFENKRIYQGYKNTIIYVVLGTAASLVTTSLGAYALSKKKMPFRGPILFLIVFSILFSGGMIPTYLVVKELGLINTIWAMVFPGMISTFHLLVFRAFFEGIPEELEDSGRIDGLHDLGIFIYIVAPLSKAVYAAIGLFVAVAIWNDFYRPFLYMTDQSLYPLQNHLRELVMAGALEKETGIVADRGMTIVIESLKYATIMVGTLPVLLLYPLLQKHFVKGVLIGSVKG